VRPIRDQIRALIEGLLASLSIEPADLPA